MALTRIIPKIIFIAALSTCLFTSCTESDEQKLAKEKATQDSLHVESNRKEEKSLEDSMVNVAKSPKQNSGDSTQVDGSADPGVK